MDYTFFIKISGNFHLEMLGLGTLLVVFCVITDFGVSFQWLFIQLFKLQITLDLSVIYNLSSVFSVMALQFILRRSLWILLKC